LLQWATQGRWPKVSFLFSFCLSLLISLCSC
jgi:hypothetical protein